MTAPRINWEDQEVIPEQDASGLDPKKYDWIQVKTVRKWKGPHPILSESVQQAANEDLEKHIEEKYDHETKTKPQKQMTNEQRRHNIQKMLAKQGLQVGIGPITRDRAERLQKALMKKGVFKPGESPAVQKQNTMKSLIKGWAIKNLKMTEKDWDMVTIEEIIVNENTDMVFLRCTSHEVASRVSSKARNLPKDSNNEGPRLMMHVDQRALKRYRASK